MRKPNQSQAHPSFHTEDTTVQIRGAAHGWLAHLALRTSSAPATLSGGPSVTYSGRCQGHAPPYSGCLCRSLLHFYYFFNLQGGREQAESGRVNTPPVIWILYL